jgi:hypothetical protein
MQNPRTLLRNTRASLRFHKRLILFLVALLVIVLGVVALSSALNAPGFIAAGDSSVTDDNNGTSVTWGNGGSTGGSTTGQYSVYTTTEPTATPDHPTVTPTNPPTTPTTTPFIPFTDTPEYGLGGGLLAVFVGFVAFTLFLRRNKSQNP